MIRRLTLLAALAALLLSACSSLAPAPAGGTPSGTPGAAKPGKTSAPAAPKVTAKPTTAAIGLDKLLQDKKVPTGSMAVAVSLWGHPETTERDLKLAKDAGFTWVKQRFEWRYIEPKKRNKFE